MSVDPLFYLKQDWEVTTLGDVAARGGGSIQTGPFGSQLHASDYVDQGIPSIMPQNISTDRISEEGIARITEDDAERLSKYRVRTGDIVYSRRGDVERRALVREENDGWLCGTGCLKVSFGEGVVVPEYAAFYLSHPASKAWVVQHAVGATMPNLNTSILSALPFVLPPSDEQEQIANALSALDDKIELNRRMNETLEEMARALFRDWFVDFGPTRRQMEGATDPAAIMGHAFPPEKAVTLASLFPAKLGDDGLPEGWETRPLQTVVEQQKQTVKPDQHLDETFEHFSLPAFDKAKWPTVERGAEIKSNKTAVPANSLLISKLNPRIERVWVPQVAGEHRQICSTEFMCFNPAAGLGRATVEALFRSDVMREKMAAMVTGTSNSHQRVPPKVLMQADVLLPVACAAAFEKVALPLLEKRQANEQKNQTLAEMRDLLLPNLMSGEIRLKDAEVPV